MDISDIFPLTHARKKYFVWSRTERIKNDFPNTIDWDCPITQIDENTIFTVSRLGYGNLFQGAYEKIVFTVDRFQYIAAWNDPAIRPQKKIKRRFDLRLLQLLQNPVYASRELR